jgi:hypothetical protein
MMALSENSLIASRDATTKPPHGRDAAGPRLLIDNYVRGR